MQSQWDERYQPADAEIVKRIAKRMSGRNGFGPSDVEDIEQDLAGHVAMQMHRFDPSRGSREKFVSKVAKNKLLNLIEQRTAKKRDNRRDVRADDLGEGVLLDGANAPDRIDRAIDVREVIARLPADLRQVALLRQQHSEKELEGLLNLTRPQVRGRLQRIERIFREAGLAPDSDE